MASYLSLVILTLTLTISISATISSARVIPAEPVSVMLDAYGNPVLFLREKRAPIRQPVIPQRAMMFTGYYRPARRSYDSNQGAAGVFAQGNAVSGGSYLSGIPHLRKGPQPIEEPEPEISSAQAEAAPAPAPEPEIYHQTYDQEDQHDFQDQNQDSPAIPEGQHETPISDPEPLPHDIEAPTPSSGVENHEGQEPVEGEVASPPAVSSRPVPPAKKGKKRPVFDEDQEDDEDEIEDEEPYVPFLPVNKGNKRRQGARIPNYNNLFPMMFSFPGLSTRAGSRPGSSPGVITAIANSYSTGKGGVASSVATAYGGPPNGKKARRAPTAEE